MIKLFGAADLLNKDILLKPARLNAVRTGVRIKQNNNSKAWFSEKSRDRQKNYTPAAGV
jgi:hypothetical protein